MVELQVFLRTVQLKMWQMRRQGTLKCSARVVTVKISCSFGCCLHARLILMKLILFLPAAPVSQQRQRRHGGLKRTVPVHGKLQVTEEEFTHRHAECLPSAITVTSNITGCQQGFAALWGSYKPLTSLKINCWILSKAVFIRFCTILSSDIFEFLLLFDRRLLEWLNPEPLNHPDDTVRFLCSSFYTVNRRRLLRLQMLLLKLAYYFLVVLIFHIECRT